MRNFALRRFVLCLTVLLILPLSLTKAYSREKQKAASKSSSTQAKTSGKPPKAVELSLETEEVEVVELELELEEDVLGVSFGERLPLFSWDLSVLDLSQLGATLTPINATLRSQLNLSAEGGGVVVASINKGGPAEKAGLKADDILLTASGKPIKKGADLEALVEKTKEKKIEVSLLRRGDRIKIDLSIAALKANRERLWTTEISLSTTALNAADSLYIGVTAVPVDRALRAHLKLPQSQGLVVTEIVKQSPAAKAGILKHDVLLKIGDKKLEKVADLQKIVSASKGKPLAIELIRTGAKQTLNVTPKKRHPLDRSQTIKVFDFSTGIKKGQKLRKVQAGDYGFLRNTEKRTSTVRHPAVLTRSIKVASQAKEPPAQSDRLTKQLEQLLKKVDKLQQSVDELQKNQPKKPSQQ